MAKKCGDGGIDSGAWKEGGAAACAFERSVGEGVAPCGGGPREDCIRELRTEDGKELWRRIPGRREGHVPVAI
jgi:hypothetical protein